jgi:hypothetical protein
MSVLFKPRTFHGSSRVRHPAGHGPALSCENSWFQSELTLEAVNANLKIFSLRSLQLEKSEN